ncbi:hypothetical protein [Sphingomonas xinjiangensis]|uniref:Uncharacterized protein YbjQ (UPF0145 family) n=1 Tax=Sphingomonas xinjiangensis TaxID=643568 RepID=A0A840YJ99_9SPHN|nr:hypothetical protein [Sphingomonas xinjiangensis]MBB5708896.1 uncharacterized protein YbjQ (UPF0145 family) [Sphingomonas xinjiangensis]
MLDNGGLRRPVTLGPVRVRLTGVVKGESDHNIASVNAPTVAEATAALHRTARVNGADAVVQVSSDHRRTALATGPLSVETLVEVQAWGVAVSEMHEMLDTQPAGGDHAPPTGRNA